MLGHGDAISCHPVSVLGEVAVSPVAVSPGGFGFRVQPKEEEETQDRHHREEDAEVVAMMLLLRNN